MSQPIQSEHHRKKFKEKLWRSILAEDIMTAGGAQLRESSKYIIEVQPYTSKKVVL
jgi:hypothetical protein